VLVSRRAFLAASAGAVAAVAAACESSAAGPVNVRREGARGDGFTKDTAALQRAVDKASRQGGNVVVVPPGRYLCGTIHLRRSVHLYLAKGAVIVGSPDDNDYQPLEVLPYESYADKETSDAHFALLAADGVSGIKISGRGEIDANRTSRGGPKPIGLKRCVNVAIADVTISNSPNYALSLIGCDNVDVARVRVMNSFADGIDPDSCQRVSIRDCVVDAFDDGICLKASLALGQPRATKGVSVTGCTVFSSSSALKIGTETSSDVSDVVFMNCRLYGRQMPGTTPREAEGGGVSIESVDGSKIDGVTVDGIRMVNIAGPLFVRLGARGRAQPTPTPGSIRNIAISNVTARGAERPSSIAGLPGARITDVRLVNVSIASDTPGRPPAGPVPELPADYPQNAMWGPLPAAVLWARHVDGLLLQNVDLTPAPGDGRLALVTDDVVALVQRDAVKSPRS
jgi:polygalacturonase